MSTGHFLMSLSQTFDLDGAEESFRTVEDFRIVA